MHASAGCANVVAMVCPRGYACEAGATRVRNMAAERHEELDSTQPPTVSDTTACSIRSGLLRVQPSVHFKRTTKLLQNHQPSNSHKYLNKKWLMGVLYN